MISSILCKNKKYIFSRKNLDEKLNYIYCWYSACIHLVRSVCGHVFGLSVKVKCYLICNREREKTIRL